MARFSATSDPADLSFTQKLRHVNWSFVILVCVIACVGFAMLYSAGNGSMTPWASRQAMRFSAALALMICVALVDIRIWLRYAYWFYFIALCLVTAVDVIGHVGMGAQRWLHLGFFQIQPSEVMKIALILALARYFHGVMLEDVARPTRLAVPLLLVLAPVALVLKQPDLGTAMMLTMMAGAIFFLAGVRLWMFGVVIAAAAAAGPLAWNFLKGYQKDRIYTFLDPESDPLGAGYHIMQSKIALGSGGIFGRGFLEGTQSHLNFLPEKQTDFIFTMLAEELGLVGGVSLIALYAIVVALGFALSVRVRNQFGRLVGMGVTTTFFLYVFINIAMVMGLIPVVGVPLPLISYGGTAMITIMAGFGLLLSASIHRNVRIGRYGHTDEA
jgi:rod shape determining protein RodA